MQKTFLKFNNHSWQVYLRDQIDQSVFNEIFKFKEYRRAEEQIINAKNPILDVGSHIGLFSLYCRALNEQAKIFAVEPEADNLKILEQNIKENNLKNIEIVSAALSDKTGEGNLIISSDNHNHYLADDFLDDSFAAVQAIKVFSLPDLLVQYQISKISLLKMDIEGAEYKIFESLSFDDFLKIQAIIMEYHISSKNKDFKIIENKLRENKFSVEIFPSHFDRKMGFLWALNKTKQ